ncbi:MAG: TonB family protein [Fibrobacteres bacterium]|jgi:TonB family protein|nr:TonB family protein [Fibrobacterota bacterium]
MSGSKVLSFREQNSPGPLEEKLRVEDDRRLLSCTGAGSMLGSAFAAWALTVQIMLPPPLVDPPVDPHPGHYTAVPPKDYHGSIKDQRLVKNHVTPGQTGNKSPKPKTAHVAKKPGWLGQSLITSRTNRLDINASEILSHAFKHMDVDKLTELPVLKHTSESRISGRRGAESHEFNIEYTEEGTGCAGADCGPGVLPELPHSGTRAPTALSSTARVSSIEYAQENNARSSAAILAVIRSHGPGLRHAYNSFLKRYPGLAGKLSLSFSIAPGGDVVELAVVSSTTGAADFDAEVGRLVRSWRFDPVRAPGNDHVTVPFTFSE